MNKEKTKKDLFQINLYTLSLIALIIVLVVGFIV